jgi:hypothetical protein
VLICFAKNVFPTPQEMFLENYVSKLSLGVPSSYSTPQTHAVQTVP